MHFKRATWKHAFALTLVPVLFGACSGRSSADLHGGAFVVVDTYPAINGRIRLNERIRVEFSRPIDLETVNFNSMSFLVRDESGASIDEPVLGSFVYGRDAEGATDPRVVEFVPRIPSDDAFSNGGFRPGRNYLVSFVSASTSAAPTVRDAEGRELSPRSPLRSLPFATVSGSTAAQLFLDDKRGGPRVVRVTPSRLTQDGKLPLGRMSAEPISIRVDFDQALSPVQSNVPWLASRDPRDASEARKGRVWLEYDDPVLGADRWIPATTLLPRNESGAASVVLYPDGVLPNLAEIRVVVDAGLADIAGETNERDRGYDPVVARFETEAALARQFDAVVWDFESEDLSDPRYASFDPPAELRDAALRASFDFDGVQSRLHYDPRASTNVLNTEFTRLPPANGLPIDVFGGVFRVHDLTVRAGVTVQGVGRNPMVWLASGDVRIDGHLHVDGGRGAQVDGLVGAQYPVAGGQGVCGGGNGGRGSPSNTGTSPSGGNGWGPSQREDGGGRGGSLACGGGVNFGAGGGGGSHVQQGDEEFASVFGGDTLTSGRGGDGRSARAAPGGAAGPRVVRDSDDENDFWGRSVDVATGRVEIGELLAPVGGSGGGGGGDRTPDATNCDSGAGFGGDSKGGGGGGGAGVLLVRALGTITIGPEGRVTANGGDGGGGQSAGSSRQGGGGGGGSGGMIVLEAPKIVLYQHGARWKDRDVRFAVSADGGVGSDSAARRTKYAAGGRPNRGGMGGMGLVQLMTPPGVDSDGTGNVLDDNIVVLDAKNEPLPKQDYLFDGDIRPNPVLLPARYGRFSSWSSRYVDTGASARRVVSAAEAGPRSTTSVPRDVDDPLYGPDYGFGGTHAEGGAAGYLRTDASGRLAHAEIAIGGVREFALARVADEPEFARGRAALRVELDVDTAATELRLEDASLRVLDAQGNATGEHRIVRAEGRALWLDARDGVLASGARRGRVVRKFVDVYTGHNPGLGDTYEAIVKRVAVQTPIRNVRIGFAFHSDPSQALDVGDDPGRFPRRVGTYVYDLESEEMDSVRERLRKLHYRFVKTHVRFNLNYDPSDPDGTAGPNRVAPNPVLPWIRWISLPFAK